MPTALTWYVFGKGLGQLAIILNPFQTVKISSIISFSKPMYINKTTTKKPHHFWGGTFLSKEKMVTLTYIGLCTETYQLCFMIWEVDVTTHANAEITDWIHPGFTGSFLDQPGWTWNKSSTRWQLINFVSTIPSSVNKLLELFWRLLFSIMKVKSLSRVRLFATPGTAAHQAPPSMGFSRQEYWSGLPFPSPNGSIRILKC